MRTALPGAAKALACGGASPHRVQHRTVVASPVHALGVYPQSDTGVHTKASVAAGLVSIIVPVFNESATVAAVIAG